eukprot:NODE_74_length_24438_cov_0.900283.p9 type:complete len:197 gc:universal NODE_74_length_24438_cov_0.900283:23348-23938(+)
MLQKSLAKNAISKLNFDQKVRLGKSLRVNHAGEVGANFIYDGQLKFIGDPLKPLIQHMKEQELEHLNMFNELLPMTNTRPSMLLPAWKVGGFILGATTSLLGREMAMLCTEAVETEIGKHYNDQLRDLIQLEEEVDDELKPFFKELQITIQKFRDDELAHKDIALNNDSKSAPQYELVSKLIGGGCKLAIEVAKRF